MRLGLILPDERAYCGSAYRIGESLRRICGLEVFLRGQRLGVADLMRCDALLVKGDSSTAFALAAGLEMPYLLLCNDVASMRDPDYDRTEIEREMIEGAAAIVFVTEPLHAYCEERYDLPPHEVVNLRPLARDLEFEPLPKLPGKTLVYAGGLLESRFAASPWGYRCYADIFAAALRAGWQVYVYPATRTSGPAEELAELGCEIHDPVPERELPRELSQYGAGLQGFNERGVPPEALDYARLAVPNKTWLYLAAGIPTIGVNPGWESGKVYDGRWGVVLPSLEAFSGLVVFDLPVITPQLRASQTIEQDLPKLRRLVGELGTARVTSFAECRG